MEETIALIDEIIEEHQTIIQKVQALEQAVNDAEAIVGLEEAKEVFMPGRLEQKQGLQKLQELLQTIDEGIQAHFNREETVLLTAFEKHGDKELASALNSLLLEHEDLRGRITHSKEEVAELTSGRLSRQAWEASGYGVRAHISHTRKLIQAHAENEQELLRKLQTELKEREGKRLA